MPPRRKDNFDESTSTKGSQSTAPTDPGNATQEKPDILPLLAPPSEEEAKYYYLDIPSRPRLIGRTTAGEILWKPPANWGVEYTHPDYDLDPPVLLVTPIGGAHRALDEIEGLLPQLKEAIKSLNWTSIDLLRIGSSKTKMAERPVVLWIGVQRDESRVGWDTVARALRAVRQILDSAFLADVQCEIREASVAPLGPPPVFAPGGRETFTDEWISKHNMTTALGQTIVPAMPGDGDWGGTLCLYVCVSGEVDPPILALTCRHVCLPTSNHPNNRSHQREPDEKTHKIYFPSDQVLKDAFEQVEGSLDLTTYELRELEAKALENANDGDAERDVRRCKEAISRIRERLQTLHRLIPLPARDIGSVICSPPIAAIPGPNGKLWTRDWGLVKLKADKFPRQHTKNEAELLEQHNWFSNERDLKKFFENIFKDHCHLPQKFVPPTGGLLPVKGVVSLGELEWLGSGRADQPNAPADTKEAREEAGAPVLFDKERPRVLLVGKRGKASGLTWGAVSEFRSVVRTVHPALAPFQSRELAVIGTLDKKKNSFSEPGDSGSLVFDVTGRAVAMVTAGSTSGSGLFDVSYCTPMELILEDIAKELGRPVRLL